MPVDGGTVGDAEVGSLHRAGRGEYTEVGASEALIRSEQFPKRRLVDDLDAAAVGRKFGRPAGFA